MYNPKRRYAAPQAQVQRQQKRVHWTVTDIGGPAELARWKASQIIREADWAASKAKRYETAKKRAVAILCGESTYELTETDRMEMRRAGTPPVIIETKLQIRREVEHKKLSWFQLLKYKFVNSCKAVWSNAFPDHL